VRRPVSIKLKFSGLYVCVAQVWSACLASKVPEFKLQYHKKKKKKRLAKFINGSSGIFLQYFGESFCAPLEMSALFEGT
jgi:hypothetical protein